MPYKPDWWDGELKNLCGTNYFGENILRVVFGPDERDHNGRMKYIDPQKGGPMECWVLERWQPPTFFGDPEQWDEGRYFQDDVSQTWVDLKGPFPLRGKYTMTLPLTKDGSFLPLDENLMLLIRKQMARDRDFAESTEAERNEAVKKQQEILQKEKSDEVEKEQENIREYHLKNWDKIGRSMNKAYSTHTK